MGVFTSRILQGNNEGIFRLSTKSDLLLRLSTTSSVSKMPGEFIWSRKYEELVRALKTFGSQRASLE